MNPERIAMPEEMMERAIEPNNWEAALHAVERNDGAPGPDGKKARELRAHLAVHGEVIKQRLLEGRYQPGAARRKEIPKPNGGTRPLSVPNVQDRFVAQLLLGVLQPLFEPGFSELSYGFRPGRSAQQAVKATKGYAQAGHTWVVDMDITQFFDRVNHDILMNKLGVEIRDKRMLRIIGRFLRAGVVMPDGVHVRSEEGTPQGGPLSPLLANVYLDALDKELEKRGLHFARYADDCNIYVGSEKAAQRVLASVSEWIQKHLRLEVNPKKSGTGRPWERKFLGYVITTGLLIGISTASLNRFEDKVRSLWSEPHVAKSTQLRDRWNDYVRGWWGYYQLCEDRKAIYRKEPWIRRHIRKCFWLRWHSSAGRIRALTALGVSPHRAVLGRSSRGAWRMAANPVVQQALSNKTLNRYQFLMPSNLGS